MALCRLSTCKRVSNSIGLTHTPFNKLKLGSNNKISSYLNKRNYSSTNIPPLPSSDPLQTPLDSKDELTHFGFRTVKAAEKASLVGHVFSNVADKYDVMNDAMSAGIHRIWKNEFVNILNPTPGSNIIDVAGGTGDIAFRIMEAMKSSPRFPAFVKSQPSPNDPLQKPTLQRKQSSVLVCDINPEMLEVGKSRAKERGYTENGDPSIRWMVGDAENLANIPDNSMDAYTIAFGIRNCTHVDQVIREAYRVLKKGGRFLVLEFSHIETFGLPNPILQGIYDAYSFNVIPVLGQAIANDRASYQYLVESIRKFPNQAQFCEMIENEGFSMVSYKNLTFGVAAVHSAFKLH